MEILRKTVALALKISDLKDELKMLELEYADAQEKALEYMSEEGIQRINVDGRTLYIHEQMWASAEDGMSEQLVQHFLDHGQMEMVSVGSQRLSGYVRELYKEWETPGEAVEDTITKKKEEEKWLNLVKVSVKRSARVRK